MKPSSAASAFAKFADEIKVAMESEPNAPDRVVGVMYGALVENQLTALLKVKLRQDEEIWEKLFRPGAAVGSFGPKLQLTYMMNLLSKVELSDIDKIVKIRNQLAHTIDVNSFEKQPIRDWIGALSTNQTFELMYKKYSNSAKHDVFVFNGIIFRKDSRRSIFQWAAYYYYQVLSNRELIGRMPPEKQHQVSFEPWK